MRTEGYERANEMRLKLGLPLIGIPPIAKTVIKPLTVVSLVSYKDWPIWAKALKLIAKPEDNGIGDVVARTIGKENSEAFKAWHLKTFNKPCDCTGRQARWNKMYPLP